MWSCMLSETFFDLEKISPIFAKLFILHSFKIKFLAYIIKISFASFLRSEFVLWNAKN